MRRLLGIFFACTLLLVGCTPGDEQPAPAPSADNATPPDGLPAATDALAAVAAALTAKDVSTVPMVHAAADAQADFTTIFAGMDDIYPAVTASGLRYEGDDTAVGALTMDYPLGLHGWTYDTEARFSYVGDQWRLAWEPSIIHPDLTSESRLRHTQREAKRAAINDNAGLAIVEERTLYEVGLDKGAVVEAEWSTAAGDLADVLGIDAAAFRAKVEANGPKAFVVAVTLRQDAIPAAVTEVPGAHVREISAVVGPSDSFAAPLLGTVGQPTQEMIDKSDGALTAQDRVGLSGLQARYNDDLRGVPQIKVDLVARKSEGASQAPFEERTLFLQEESISKPITLSLDRDLQAKAEEVLSTQSGLATLAVIDVKTGGVLAAAQSPSGGSYPYVTFGKYAPGSTFKAVSALALLRTGLTPSSTVQCPSSLKVDTYTFGNYSGYPSSSTGSIPLQEAFTQSCNTAFAGGKITAAQLHDAAASLGVGTDYDTGFTYYLGTVEPGNAIDLAASMIGQGQVTMSPLGMASVAASVAAGKTTIPWLVEGHQATPSATPLSETEAKQLQEMMTATVQSGTGKALQGVMTGAKTGTAQWGKAGELQTSAWMIAYNDTYAVSAFVEVGDSGGTTAAPLIVKLFS